MCGVVWLARLLRIPYHCGWWFIHAFSRLLVLILSLFFLLVFGWSSSATLPSSSSSSSSPYMPPLGYINTIKTPLFPPTVCQSLPKTSPPTHPPLPYSSCRRKKRSNIEVERDVSFLILPSTFPPGGPPDPTPTRSTVSLLLSGSAVAPVWVGGWVGE